VEINQHHTMRIEGLKTVSTSPLLKLLVAGSTEFASLSITINVY